MPVTLPPLSRRQFFTRSIVASAGLVLGPNLLARKNSDEENWALLSDIHISSDSKRMAREINMTDNLVAVRNEVLAWKNSKGVLISGDLAFNSGETADYEAVTKLLLPLRQSGLPVHLALGNHDHRERFWSAMSEDKTVDRSLANRQVAIVRTPFANWFVLDSLIKTVYTPGELGEAQRHWLTHALDANANKPAIIVIHHNPSFGYEGALDDTKELFEILRPRKQVKAYFYGHSHFWGVSRDESGIHLINLPPVAYVFEPWRPNGWVKLTLRKGSAHLELRCLDTANKQHGEKWDLNWRERA